MFDMMGDFDFDWDGGRGKKKSAKKMSKDDMFMADPRDVLKFTGDVVQGLAAVHLGMFVVGQTTNLAHSLSGGNG